MTKEEIVALGIKVASLLMIFFILRDSATLLATIDNINSLSGINNWAVFSIIVMCSLFVFSVLLYNFPLTFAKGLLPKSESEAKISGLTIDDLQIAAFTVLGAFLFVYAVSDSIYWATVLYTYVSIDTSNQEISLSYIGNILATIFELCIAGQINYPFHIKYEG